MLSRFLHCGQQFRAAESQEESELAVSPLASFAFRMIADSGAADAPENGKGALRHAFLPDDLAAELDLALQAPGQIASLLFGSGPHDQVAPAANDVVALGLESVGKLPGLSMGLPLDPHLPRRVAAVELLFLPGLLPRLAGPALLAVHPALDCGGARLDPFVGELGLDDPARLLRLSW